MTIPEMEGLVRDVIVHRGLPFAIVSVTAAPPGFEVRVRAGTGGMVTFNISDSRPVWMRTAIQEKLEAEL